MPSRDKPTAMNRFRLKEMALCRMVGEKPHTHTQTHAANSPSSWKCKPTHSREAVVIFTSGRVKAEERTEKLRQRWGGEGEVSGRWEWVANAGDWNSLVTRWAWQKRIAAFPYYIHRATGNFLSPVWLRDPRPLLVLLPTTMDELNEDGLQAPILHVSNAQIPLLTCFDAGLSVFCGLF